jgi:two-component sensor histidine kinase
MERSQRAPGSFFVSRSTRPFSVRTYFFALVTAVVVPLLFFSAFILNKQLMVERERLSQQATELAQNIALIVDAELNSLVAALQGLASSSALLNGDLRVFYDEASRVVSGKDQIVVLREYGRLQLLNTQSAFGSALPDAVEMAEADQNALRRGEAAISPVYASPVSGEPRVAVAIAVIARTESHVLAMTVPTSRFRHVMPKVPSDWIVGVGDPRSGKFVTRSQRHDEVSGKLADPKYFANATGTSGSFSATTLDGRTVLAAYYYGNVSKWLVAANVPRSIIEAPLWQSLYAIAALGVGALILSVLFAWLLGRNVTSAATELARRAAALGAGDGVGPSALRVSEFQHISEALVASAIKIQEREQQRDKVEAQRQQLVAELDHRVKNTLAVVQSLLVQTLRHSSSLAEARAAFSDRLQALSAAHDILTRENWGAADLQDLLLRVTAPYVTRERFTISGPSVRLPPAKVVSLAMLFNELATNAVKYGALSSETGSVTLTWEMDEHPYQLRVEWQEQGGPALAPPNKEGFGSKLIREIMPGTTSVTYLPLGLRCELRIPLDDITPASAPH